MGRQYQGAALRSGVVAPLGRTTANGKWQMWQMCLRRGANMASLVEMTSGSPKEDGSVSARVFGKQIKNSVNE